MNSCLQIWEDSDLHDIDEYIGQNEHLSRPGKEEVPNELLYLLRRSPERISDVSEISFVIKCGKREMS